MAAPGSLDAIATITLTLYGNGEMAVSGNIEDIKMATSMLDQAKEAVVSSWHGRHNKPKLLIPNRDVVVAPELPLDYYGDVPQELRPASAGGPGGHFV
jgi:hypothetical protein